MTNSIEETLNTDLIFIIGSNTTETHPVISTFMKRAIKRGAKLIVADPRRIELSQLADVYLQIKPGTNVALLNGMMNVILEEELYDKEFIEKNTENFEAFREVIKGYTPEVAAQICNVDKEDIIKAARLYARAPKAGIYYTMGVTQHSTGTSGVMSISNLSLLCGNVGKESAGVNPLRGQNNVQGSTDMGAVPTDYPGYQKVFKPEVKEKFEKAWNAKLSGTVGLTVAEMMKEAEKGNLKFMYIMGENPMVSDPDISHVDKALRSLDFLVVQDLFLTETAEYADVVLPASSFAEKDGTFTNTERRVQRVRQGIKPVGNSKPDWQILSDIMKRLGHEKEYSHPSEIMEEIRSVTPQYGGITYERIEEEGLQWPCPDLSHPGTKYLHKDKIMRGKGLFMPIDYRESVETPDEEYPFILTTGRLRYHYHTRTLTGRVEGLNKLQPHSFMEINEATASRLGIADGEKVRVISRRGEIVVTARITDAVDENVLFIPFHFADTRVNYLTHTMDLDEYSKIPELKVTAVKLERMGS